MGKKKREQSSPPDDTVGGDEALQRMADLTARVVRVPKDEVVEMERERTEHQ